MDVRNLRTGAATFLLAGLLCHGAAASNEPSLIPAPGLAASRPILPSDATTKITMSGSVDSSWGSSGVRMTVAQIVNSRSSGTSGNLQLWLWATTALPVDGQGLSGYVLGKANLGTLQAGFEFNNVDTGFVAYSPPADGCYYVTVAVEELETGTYFYDDLSTATGGSGGVPAGNGFVRFGFGSNTCGVTPPPPPPPAGCTASSTQACVLNGRFAVTVKYQPDFSDSPATAQALLKTVTGFANTSFETAFFYFNDVNNIEMMIKMLDQGNQNASGQPTIALLYGSATPLRIELTITDTSNGAVRSYLSHAGSQQGGVDFTAFVK